MPSISRKALTQQELQAEGDGFTLPGFDGHEDGGDGDTATMPLEGILAAAGLNGEPFYFGHFVGGPAAAFAAHA
jgi:hypothetical protein